MRLKTLNEISKMDIIRPYVILTDVYQNNLIARLEDIDVKSRTIACRILLDDFQHREGFLTTLKVDCSVPVWFSPSATDLIAGLLNAVSIPAEQFDAFPKGAIKTSLDKPSGS